MKRLAISFTMLLLATLFASLAIAAESTTGGTIIKNKATASFVDSNNISDSTESNEVTTIVNTVYSFEVDPDNSQSPDGATDGAIGTFVLADAQTDNTKFAGDQVCFPYTIENSSNVAINVTLNAQQYSSGDDFNLDNLEIYIDNGTVGTFESGTDTLVSGQVPLAQSDNVAGSGGDFKNLLVCGTIPAGTDAAKVANLDLTATNDTAISDSNQTNGTANKTFENHNLAQVEVAEDNKIGLAKNTDSVTNNNDGTYDIQMTFTAENFGNSTLTAVQITDDLDGQLGDAGSGEPEITGFSTPAPTLSAGEVALTVNGSLVLDSDATLTNNINGAGVTNLLAGTDSLDPGVVGKFTLIITVDFKTNAGNTDGVDLSSPVTLENNADIAGTPPSGTPITDCSVNGTDPDPNGDNDPASGPETGTDASSPADTSDECSNTPIEITENAQLGVSKDVGTITKETDGSFIIPIDIYVENLGNVRIDNIQITEELLSGANPTFPAGSVITIDTAPISNASPKLPGNSSFNGDGDVNLLDPSAAAFTATNDDTDRSLDVGQTAIVSFVIRVTPSDNLAGSPYQNKVNTIGETPTGKTGVSDCSVPGTDPDPNGDGDPGVGPDSNNNHAGDTSFNNECAPTELTLDSGPSLGLAKELVGSVQDNNDGTFTATFRFTAENMGNVALTNVQITDDLASTFDIPASTVNVLAVSDPVNTTGSTPAVTPNTDYNGGVDGNAVHATPDLKVAEIATLGIGETIKAEVSVTFDPNDESGPFNNSANVEGTPPSGPPTTNCSVNGSDPDVDPSPSGDGVPDSCTPTPIPVPATPAIGIAKIVDTHSLVSGSSYQVIYDIRIENIGNVTLNNVQAVDDLATVFGASQLDETNTSVALKTNSSSMTAGNIVSTTFDGESDTNLLKSNVKLEPQEFVIVTVTARVNIASSYGPYNNSATATGEPVSDPSTPVTDTSDNGVDVDPDDDGNADEDAGAVCDGDDLAANCENDPTPVTFIEPSDLKVQKFQRVVSDVADCDTPAEFNNAAFNQSQASTDPGVFICYHIVAQNRGTSDVTQVVINDIIPQVVRDVTGGGLVENTLSARKHDADSTFDFDDAVTTDTGVITTVGSVASVTAECSTSGASGPFSAANCTGGFSGSPSVDNSITDVQTPGTTLEKDPNTGSDGAILELNFAVYVP